MSCDDSPAWTPNCQKNRCVTPASESPNLPAFGRTAKRKNKTRSREKTRTALHSSRGNIEKSPPFETCVLRTRVLPDDLYASPNLGPGVAVLAAYFGMVCCTKRNCTYVCSMVKPTKTIITHSDPSTRSRKTSLFGPGSETDLLTPCRVLKDRGAFLPSR
jgi:hypothetical protein